MMRADADAGALRAAPRRAGWTMFVRGLWLLLIWLAMPATAGAQATWTGGASLATYFFPDDDDVLQPTAFGDRGALHLEVRYNYEDVRSTSVFGGWNLEFGSTVKLMLTPMAGFVAGQTDGGIAGVKVNLAWRRLEAYTEGEFVVPSDGQNRFLYNWSEFSVWTTDWLRAGLVTQRTRTFRRFRTARDIERGLLIGVAGSKLEGAFYFFNPGSDDKYFVASISMSFGK